MLSGGQWAKTLGLCSLVLLCIVYGSVACPVNRDDLAVLRVLNGRWGSLLGWTAEGVEKACQEPLFGVTCNGSRVTEISFPLLGLTGQLPDEIGSLSALKVLDLTGNQLQRAIPDSYQQLASLEKLYLGDNALSGLIPWQFGDLPHLRELDLHGNTFFGEIPTNLARSSTLQVLNLRRNALNSALPLALRNLVSLEVLDVRNNRMLGAIPDIWGNLPSLRALFLSDNFFWNPIPQSIADLPNLLVFEANNNNLYLCPTPDLSRYRGYVWDVSGQRFQQGCNRITCSSDKYAHWVPRGNTGMFTSCEQGRFQVE